MGPARERSGVRRWRLRSARPSCGNAIILLQPGRGSKVSEKQGYHDITVPPRHAYVAVYAHLRETVGIDALVHVGTHGTLEWLPGKAIALSEACAPEAILGPLQSSIPSSSTIPVRLFQAKRRISAVSIGHLTPPLSDAGLHGALAELEGLIEEFAEADGVDRRRTQLLEAEIVDRAWASGLAADCGVTKADTPRGHHQTRCATLRYQGNSPCARLCMCSERPPAQAPQRP